MSYESRTLPSPPKPLDKLPISVGSSPDGEYVVIEAEGYPAIGLPNSEAFLFAKTIGDQIQRNLDFKKSRSPVS